MFEGDQPGGGVSNKGFLKSESKAPLPSVPVTSKKESKSKFSRASSSPKPRLRPPKGCVLVGIIISQTYRRIGIY